jgi:hypothetical protein
VGDFNGDGHADLIVAKQSSNRSVGPRMPATGETIVIGAVSGQENGKMFVDR